MEISAPYNFVPLSSTVVFPKWADAVSHDIPFEEGISGTITCELTTVSPVYVRNGGNWEKNEKCNDILEKPEAQSFFKVGNEYIIPGTSLKGMIRNVVEIASFGKMCSVADKRYAVRDLQNFKLYGHHMTASPGGIYTPKPKAAWLIADKEGKWHLQPCTFVRVEQIDLARMPNGIAIGDKLNGAYPCSVEKYEDLWGSRSKTVRFDLMKDYIGNVKQHHNHSSPDFRDNEFKKSLTVQKLCRAIEADGFKFSLRNNVKTVGWLNELLQVQDLWAQMETKKNPIPTDPKILELKKEYAHSKKLKDLKTINRALLNHAYGRVAPTFQQKWLRYEKAENLGNKGSEEGMLVFTGQPSSSKHMEFIFVDVPNSKPIPLQSDGTALSATGEKKRDIRREFEFVNCSNGNLSKEWAYWHKKLGEKDGRVPVFYLEDEGTITSMGLALMYKLPYEYTILEAIGHTSKEHLNMKEAQEHKADFADVIFGYVGLKKQGKEKSLRGRISFSSAIADSDSIQHLEKVETVLGAPKPTYYPIYLEQPNPKSKEGYKTFMDSDCKISGWKRYPARRNEIIPKASEMPKALTEKVKTVFDPIRLKAGAKFTFTIHVHNLLPVELGALLWALTWGGESNYVHSLGMGKSLGYGQVKIDSLVPCLVKAADSRSPYDCNVERLIKEYADYMKARLKEEADKGKKAAAPKNQPTSDFAPKCATIKASMDSENLWCSSDQMKQLLAMVDPEYYDCAKQKERLRPMKLGMRREDNEFVNMKDARLALKPYAGEQANG